MPAGSFTVQVGTQLIPTPGSRLISNIFGIRTDSLIVLDSSVLDREDINHYVFTVEATDTLLETSTATVTILITDINDETPVITNPE